jgi:hypothetical protein
MRITPTSIIRRRGRTGWLRLSGLLAALTFSITLGPISAGRGYAQPSPQLSGGFPALTLTYTDAQGPGQATITPQGPDGATGGTAIAVTLIQNGITYSGAGFVRQVEARGYVTAFTLTGGSWESYVLRGMLIRDGDGVRWRGRGRWWALWNPAIGDEWRMAGGPYAAPPSRPPLVASVRLAPVAGARVSGLATLTALPDGETRFDLALNGLAPHVPHVVQLHTRRPPSPAPASPP